MLLLLDSIGPREIQTVSARTQETGRNKLTETQKFNLHSSSIYTLLKSLQCYIFLNIFSLAEMSASGTVLFNASEGYDADMWDDSALIKEYDRALESSR